MRHRRRVHEREEHQDEIERVHRQRNSHRRFDNQPKARQRTDPVRP